MTAKYYANRYDQKRIFVLIPVFNEGPVIKKVIHEIRQTGYKNIIVVDDGSTDDTLKILRSQPVISLHHILNRGKGAAVKTGIEAAKILGAQTMITLDGDGQHDPKDIHKLIAHIEKGFDVVLGSRVMTKGSNMPFIKMIANKLGNFFTWVAYGLWVEDSQSGFRAYSQRAINYLDILSEQYDFDSEVIRVIVEHHLSYKEVAIKTCYTRYSMSKDRKQSFVTGLYTLVRLLLS